MAKFKANYDFKGKAEKKEFSKNTEIDLTIKRAEEIEKNIQKQKGFEDFKLTRTDVQEKDSKE